jgi:hypothetical protein
MKSLYDDLLDFVLDNGVKIIPNSQVKSYEYNPKAKIASYSPIGSDDEIFLLKLSAIRAAYISLKGVNFNFLEYHPDIAVVLNRLIPADNMAILVQCAWEERFKNNFGPWNLLKTICPDICQAVKATAREDFRTLRDGDALVSAFECWFLSERPNFYDTKTIKTLLANFKYIKNQDSNITHQISSIGKIIACLGDIPKRKNYLVNHISTIIQDTIFTEVRGRSNANFLWFIKFEMSYSTTSTPIYNSENKNNVVKISKNEKSDPNPLGKVLYFNTLSETLHALRQSPHLK